MNIEEYIPFGRENAIKRAELVALLRLSDRMVRRQIEEARLRGEVILNDQTGAGCFRSNDVAELKRQMAQNRSRALAILRQQKHIRRRIEEIERMGEPSLFEQEVDANDRQQNKG